MSGVWVAAGTRPEAIKMAPVIRGLRAAGVETTVCATGQHGPATAETFRSLELPVDLTLPSVPEGSDLDEILAHVTRTTAAALARRPPRLLLVHGDTTGALAAARAAAAVRIPVGHVEAGLRTGDPRAPYPEELNRCAIDRLSALWFAPTATARARLLAEGCAARHVHVTGNPVVDALYRTRERVAALPLSAFPELAPLSALPADAPLVLVTAHRRESHGAPLLAICDAVEDLAASGVTAVWPVHPNPAVCGPVRARLADRPGIRLIGALPYPAFVRLMLRAQLVLTDSGGVQEEAAVLRRPTVVLRARTERPEILQTGSVCLAGTDPAAIRSAALAWLQSPPPGDPRAAPLGDGRAGERIGRIVARWLSAAARPQAAGGFG